MKGQSVTSVTAGRTSRRNKVLGPNSGTEGSAVAGAPAVCTPTGGSEVKKGAASIPSCTGCGVVIAQEVRALQCDRCARTDQWKCIECLGIPGEVYDALIDCKELNWFCSGCSEDISKCNAEKEDKVIYC